MERTLAQRLNPSARRPFFAVPDSAALACRRCIIRSLATYGLAAGFSLTFGPEAMAQGENPEATGLAAAQTGASGDEWIFRGELYGWMPSINPQLTNGDKVTIDFDEILDSLQGTFMGFLKAEYGNWTLATDLIYLDIEDRKRISNSSVDVELKNWIFGLAAAYEIAETPCSTFEVLGGARYLSIETDLQVVAGPFSLSTSETNDVWDAFVGISGHVDLSEKWYLNYYADVGAGESDFTWQALTSVSYRMKKFDLAFGYRYLDWEFDKFGPVDNLHVNGPYLGLKFSF